MYKKQLKFQKIACLLAVVASAIWFIYSLGMITEIYDALYYTMLDPDDLSSTLVEGSILFYDMQPFNRMFLYASIGLILLGCLLYLTNTHSRRKYYIGNLCSVGLYSLSSLVMIVWSHVNIASFKEQFLTTVDFEALKQWSETLTAIKYTDSTLMLDLHLVVAVISLVAVAAQLYNLYWKISVMRGEQALIEEGKEAAV